ncbi:MAG: hypothetical protein KGV51_08195 [Moraxellaceae bacterium]|nr:hypothetical protein [Moraxellaceae bacterium]
MTNYSNLFSTKSIISYGNDDDKIYSDFNDNIIDAGLGKNYINAGFGDDTLIHDFAGGANNTYIGGSGHDKVLLNISAEDLQREDVQQDLRAFARYNQDSFQKAFVAFKFKSMDLTVRSVEEIEFNILKANGEEASVDEDKSIEVDVVANDSLTSGGHISLISANVADGKGLVSIEDGKIVFDSNDNFDYLASGEQETVNIDYVIQDDANGTTSNATLSVAVIGNSDTNLSDVLVDNIGVYSNNTNFDCNLEDIFGENIPPKYTENANTVTNDNYTKTDCSPEDILYGIDYKDASATDTANLSYDCTPADVYGSNYIPFDVVI